MTHPHDNWGAGPSAGYDALAERFRPIFRRIAEGAAEREVGRILPHEEIGWLKKEGFGAVRLPVEQGGAGASLPDLFSLLIELAEADSNFTQALRAHFGFVEDVLSARDEGRRARWLPRFVAGEIVGSGWTETTGGAKAGAFATRVTRDGDRWRIDGEKFYTTGSIFAEWIDVGASDAAGEIVAAAVSTQAPGVAIVDDWRGFGQILTGSGTSRFAAAPIDRDEVNKAEIRFKYQAAFYQLVHLATLSGIGRAAAREVSRAVGQRRRTYTHATAPVAAADPQVLQVVGQVYSNAYAAGAITLKAAEAAQRAFELGLAEDAEAEDAANVRAEIEVAEAQVVVARLIFDATTRIFDALGASATDRAKALDRHWRNARTIASHNPLIYKERVVGDHAVNGARPPFLWLAGQA